MISKTVGVGGDYATLQAAIASLPVSPMDDDYTFTFISDTTETVYTHINAAGSPSDYNLAGHTLTITSDTEHYGNPLLGHTMNVNHATADGAIMIDDCGNGTIIIEKIKIKRLSGNARGIHCFDGNNDLIVHLRDLMLDANEQTTIAAIWVENDLSQLAVYNCKIWGNWGVYFTDAAQGNPLFENVTCWSSNASYAVFDLSALSFRVYVRNCYANSFTNLTRAIGYNNASQAAVGVWAAGSSGNFGGVVPANEFRSLDDTDANFLNFTNSINKYIAASADPFKGRAPLISQFTPEVKFTYASSLLAAGGVAPTYATEDIAGNSRPGDDDEYSIGCHEAQFDWRL